MTKRNEKNEDRKRVGLIPTRGLITAEELASRLRLSSVANLKVDLEEKGLKYVSFNCKRVYRCRDIDKLFGSEEG